MCQGKLDFSHLLKPTSTSAFWHLSFPKVPILDRKTFSDKVGKLRLLEQSHPIRIVITFSGLKAKEQNTPKLKTASYLPFEIKSLRGTNLLKVFVNCRIHSTDVECCCTWNLGEISPATSLKAIQVSINHCFIFMEAKYELFQKHKPWGYCCCSYWGSKFVASECTEQTYSGIYTYPQRNNLLHRKDGFISCRNLNVNIWTPNSLVKPFCLFNCPLGIIC